MLALKELLAGKVKFGLIALIIGLVVSLTLLMSAMSGGLISGMIGAKSSLDADALVFQKDTYPTFERSVLTASDLERIASTPGVRSVYGVGHAFATVEMPADESFDVRVFGLGDRFDQLETVEGITSEPGDGQAIADESARLKGVELGDTVTLEPIGVELEIVGFTENRRYIMVPTLTVSMDTWERIYIASVVGSEKEGETSAMAGVDLADRFAGSASVAAIALEDGVSIDDVRAKFDGSYELESPLNASLAGNGMTEMVLAVDGIQWASIVIGALLVGLFFYITTMHKTNQIAAIKAMGASNAFLYGQLVLQITALVTFAVLFAIALSLGIERMMPPAMAVEPQPLGWAISIAAIYLTSYIGSLFSLRSILQIDPATALGRNDQ